MKLATSFFALCLLFSCAIKKSQGTFTREEGYLYYHQTAPELGFRVFGDYFIHSPNSKYFKDVPEGFLKYSFSKINNSKPRLVFAAHTTVQPYYSSISTIYKNANLDSSFVDAIRNSMKSSLNVKSKSYQVISTNYGSAIKFDYQVLHPITRIRSTHLEYLINDNGNVLRFCFWTTESNTEISFSEAEGLVKNLEL